MSNSVKFSVIIPAYNAERYIRTAIESCLIQTYPPHEIIVVDDGSTDRTAEVAESFSSPVRVIRLAQNVGVPGARNEGIQASTGDWIALLDADDWFLPDKLKWQQRCVLENQHAVLIYARVREIAIDGTEADSRLVWPDEMWPMLRWVCGIDGVSTVLFRREAYDSVGGFDVSLKVCEDWDLWLRLALRYSVKSFVFMPVTVAVYRRVAGSMSSDAMRYFKARCYMLESKCLVGTAGLSRLLWRQQIAAFNCQTTAIGLREEGSPLDLRFILKSIVLWPFPSRAVSMRRYKIAALMMKQHLFGRLAR